VWGEEIWIRRITEEEQRDNNNNNEGHSFIPHFTLKANTMIDCPSASAVPFPNCASICLNKIVRSRILFIRP
jgi:hypothetical protein